MAATINDKIYGKLTWDEDFGESWNGKVELEPNVPVETSVWNFDPMDFLAVRQTHKIFQKIQADKAKILEFLADDLHAQYNDEWRKPGEKWLNRAAFLEKLKQESAWDSISFNEDGTAYIMFKTDLFDSYTPILNLDKNGDCADVELA